MLKEEEVGMVMRGGGTGLRSNVQYRDCEAGVAEMLPLRREVLAICCLQ